MVHVIGSVVDLFEEVFQLLDENTLLEPLQGTNDKNKCYGLYSVAMKSVKSNILCVFIIVFSNDIRVML